MAKLAQLPAHDGAPDTVAANVRRMPRLEPRYYAFLSYSHKDKALAEWVHRELERFRVPHALAGRLTANGVVPDVSPRFSAISTISRRRATSAGKSRPRSPYRNS